MRPLAELQQLAARTAADYQRARPQTVLVEAESPDDVLRVLGRLKEWALAIAGASNRFRYSWEQVQLDGDLNDQVVPGGLSGTLVTNFAVNLCEVNNAAAGVQGNGVNISGEDYPAGFVHQPLGGGRTTAGQTSGACANQVCCILERRRLANGETVWLIVDSTPNSDDGTCE